MSFCSYQRCPLPSDLSQEAVDEFFNKYDKNGDGVITKEELIGGPRVASKPPLEGHKKSDDAKAIDKFSSKKAPERALKKKESSLCLSREQMKEIFREHDVDGDGFLDFAELTRAFGFLDSIIPFYKACNGLTRADVDGDGLVSEGELDKLIDYAEKLYNLK